MRAPTRNEFSAVTVGLAFGLLTVNIPGALALIVLAVLLAKQPTL